MMSTDEGPATNGFPTLAHESILMRPGVVIVQRYRGGGGKALSRDPSHQPGCSRL